MPTGAGYPVTHNDLGGAAAAVPTRGAQNPASGGIDAKTVTANIAAASPRVTTGGCSVPAIDAFAACYYNNSSLSGNPVFTATDTQINFDWGSGSPDPSVTSGNFSARWNGNFMFNGGVYRFTATGSDGMRIYIDGNLILDAWRDQPPFMFQARPALTQGTHVITVEYYEHTGWASAHLTWRQD
jgi:hypothetical protein